jgi:hypothetical protein
MDRMEWVNHVFVVPTWIGIRSVEIHPYLANQFPPRIASPLIPVAVHQSWLPHVVYSQWPVLLPVMMIDVVTTMKHVVVMSIVLVVVAAVADSHYYSYYYYYYVVSPVSSSSSSLSYPHLDVVPNWIGFDVASMVVVMIHPIVSVVVVATVDFDYYYYYY